MPLKRRRRATDPEEIDRWDGGVGWIAYPDETLRRASHALAGEDGVWVVDPVDFQGPDDLLTERGPVAGVVVLLDRHVRDAARVARRHDVAVHLPTWMEGVADSLDVPVRWLAGQLGESEYRVHRLVDNPFWQEAALYGSRTDTLVVPEAVGTTDYFRTVEERLGVHPMLRLTPPRGLSNFDPDRVLVGHGRGVFDRPAEALADAVANARRRAPRLYAETALGWIQ